MTYQLTFCNELLAAEYPRLADQARVAGELGAMGLEIDPASLGPDAHKMTAQGILNRRAEIEGEGLRVTGLHWLLSGYPNASITDPAQREETRDIVFGLIDLAYGLGAEVMVHGSPRQRVPVDGVDSFEAMAEFFSPIVQRARQAGIAYCIEPLSRAETSVINTVAEGVALCEAVDNPFFQTMIDTSAAGQTEAPVTDLITRWVGKGPIGHIHLNDTNRGAPGAGSDPFHAILPALRKAGWTAPLGIEPFRLSGTASETFALAAKTVREHWNQDAD